MDCSFFYASSKWTLKRGSGANESPELSDLVELIIKEKNRPELVPYAWLTARKIATNFQQFQCDEEEVLRSAETLFERDKENKRNQRLFKISAPYPHMNGEKIRLITKNGVVLANLIEHHRPSEKEIGYTVVFTTDIEFTNEATAPLGKWTTKAWITQRTVWLQSPEEIRSITATGDDSVPFELRTAW